jgi:hypothetical protein
VLLIAIGTEFGSLAGAAAADVAIPEWFKASVMTFAETPRPFSWIIWSAVRLKGPFAAST